MCNRDYWCEHSTLGRVEFARGVIQPAHAILLIEHRSSAIHLPDELPLNLRGVPVSYFTLSDFCHMVQELKTFRDITDYLDARHATTELDLRLTGSDGPICGHYMLHGGLFPPGLSHEQRAKKIFEHPTDFHKLLDLKKWGDAECEEVEAVARALRRRAAGYPPRGPQDDNYRAMQLVLMDLTYVERCLLGRMIKKAEEKVTAAIVDAEKRMCSYILVRNSNRNTAIAVTASRCVSAVEAAEKMPEFVGTVCNGLEVKNVLWINIRENSPKYQVIILFQEILLRLTLSSPEIPIAEMINAGWVVWTPDARF